MRMKKGFLKSIASVIFLIIILQFLGCSLRQQADSKNPTLVNNLTNTVSESPTPANSADGNFAKEGKSKFEAASVELERNHRLWEASEIVNYDFVIAKYAGGTTNDWNRLPVVIKIRDGEKTSIEKASKDEDYVIYSRTDGFEDFDTIDKLFNYMRQELDDGKIVDAKYDKKIGYPKTVSVTFTFASNHNFRTIEISKFEVIK